MSSWSSSSRSSQRRWSSPASFGAALSARATNQSRWRRSIVVAPRRARASCSAANSRIVSSSRKRGSPSASSIRTRLWSASADQAVERRRRPSSAAGPQHGLGRLEVAAADEHRQAVEEPALAVVEQVVAPGDRAAQRLLARRQVARPGGQDVELMLEPVEDRVGREELDACRGELDRERHAVEPGGDPGDGRRVLVRHLEVRPDRRRRAR